MRSATVVEVLQDFLKSFIVFFIVPVIAPLSAFCESNALYDLFPKQFNSAVQVFVENKSMCPASQLMLFVSITWLRIFH